MIKNPDHVYVLVDLGDIEAIRLFLFRYIAEVTLEAVESSTDQAVLSGPPSGVLQALEFFWFDHDRDAAILHLIANTIQADSAAQIVVA